MYSQENMELVFDTIDETALFLYGKKKMPYIEAVVEACHHIIDNQVDYLELEDEDKKKLNGILSKIYDLKFQKEEVRKALQLIILKAFKHEKIKNSEMTPDTIGLFIGYLLNIIFEDCKTISILDPLVGTGNLLTTVANYLEKDVKLIGIENNKILYDIARVFFAMLGYEDEVYLQDTLTFNNIDVDAIICDMPFKGDIKYDVVNHHVINLKPGGYFIALIPNDYFEDEKAKTLKANIDGEISVLGLIQLPASMFKEMGKSILIMRNVKRKVEGQKFLLCELPDIDEKEKFNQVLHKIELWFLEYSQGEK